MDKELLKTLNQLEGEVILQSIPEQGVVVGTIDSVPFRCTAKYLPNEKRLFSINATMEDKKVSISNVDMGVDISYSNDNSISKLKTGTSIGYCYEQRNIGLSNAENVMPFLEYKKDDAEFITRGMILTDQNLSISGLTEFEPDIHNDADITFEQLINKGYISDITANTINKNGFVYTKSSTILDASKNILGTRYESAEGEKTAYYVCAIYKNEEEFKRKLKPSIMEVKVYHTDKNRIKEPNRRMVYTLDETGKYVNAEIDFDAENEKISPISYEVLTQYLEELKISLEPTKEFEDFAKEELENKNKQRMINISKILKTMLITKYRENAIKEDEKFVEELNKKQR